MVGSIWGGNGMVGSIWSISTIGIWVSSMGIGVDAIGGIWVGGMGIGDWGSNSLHLSNNRLGGLDSNRGDRVDNWDTSTISKTVGQTTISISSICGRIAISSIKESWVSL